jgi:hypothetical protein
MSYKLKNRLMMKTIQQDIDYKLELLQLKICQLGIMYN